MDAQTLKSAMLGDREIEFYRDLLPQFEGAARVAHVDNPLRMAMWCAQLGHESAGLRYLEEIADGSAYEGRTDLGNINPGDGKRYKGRGPIQLTGRSNYAAFSRWCYAEGYVTENDEFFVHNPNLLSDPYWGFLATAYYWTVSRPHINAMCDAGDLVGVTRAINGGTNNLNDRQMRYNHCLQLFGGEAQTVEKKILDYSRAYVTQDTYYNCGPASTQTVVYGATGKVIDESVFARELGTTENGTNWIGSFPDVLNRYISGANYVSVEMPQDPATGDQKERLWNDLKRSIDSGLGVIANIVAPPNNYPRVSYESDTPFRYGGGTVYHYLAVMGYAREDNGVRHVWLADSGFYPYGGWITFDQLATLIPPKGYVYANNEPITTMEDTMAVTQEIRDAALNDAKNSAQNTEIEVKALKGLVERLLLLNTLILDQLVGPGKREDGLPTFTGWQPTGSFAGTKGKTALHFLVDELHDISQAVKENK